MPEFDLQNDRGYAPLRNVAVIGWGQRAGWSIFGETGYALLTRTPGRFSFYRTDRIVKRGA